ncbi:aminotransferase class IV [Phenylobacterium kunshanense]|uniref:Probable branched-chain-amino-acid aminotransferase n=1 Tax=Phenylobacterium kunshanense TaxID=1445034 RepID=A0A328BCH9_9CAUL|nr:aminotransferase class IV [Phenylobacterium kunshanense]RAK64793.1 4-amino-4-deoxychorismate lyase [Phenylobacterium kunshanense]
MTDIRIDDRGFTLGHGLFETVLWAPAGPAHWDAHRERLERGCRTIGLPLPDRGELLAAAEGAAARLGGAERGAVRINWSAGPGARGLDPPDVFAPVLTASASPLGPPPGPVTLATAKVRRNDRSPASRVKSLSYLDNVLARAEARAAGAEEALMLNTAGEVACAAAANIFWIRHEEVFTPDLDCGVLDGIMRREVIAACHRLGVPVQEVFANPGRIAGAPMFITNSLVGLRSVSSLDGAPLPASPLVKAIVKVLSPGT